jgi:hypothetical protein
MVPNLLNEEQQLAYLLGSSFDKRLIDVYSGMNGKPPFFEELVLEMAEMQAAISLRTNGAFSRISDQEWNELNRRVWDPDDYTKIDLLEQTGEYNAMVTEIGMYLCRNRMSIILKNDDQFLNPPVTAIW